MTEILRRPIISEKATGLAAAGRYVFEIDPKANKLEVKDAVEKLYKVRVRRVNLIKVSPKRRILRGRPGVKPGYKKALVFLRPGDKIELV